MEFVGCRSGFSADARMGSNSGQLVREERFSRTLAGLPAHLS